MSLDFPLPDLTEYYDSDVRRNESVIHHGLCCLDPSFICSVTNTVGGWSVSQNAWQLNTLVNFGGHAWNACDIACIRTRLYLCSGKIKHDCVMLHASKLTSVIAPSKLDYP